MPDGLILPGVHRPATVRLSDVAALYPVDYRQVGPPERQPAPPLKAKKDHTGIHWSLAAMLGGHILDALSTHAALKRPGVEEANPVFGKRPGLGKLLGIKAAGAIPTAILLDKMHDKHPKLTKALALAIGGVGAGIAMRNNQQGRQ